MVFLVDNGYLPSVHPTIAVASTTDVPELVGKIESLEENLNKVKEMVGKNREGIGSCICLVCECNNIPFVGHLLGCSCCVEVGNCDEVWAFVFCL